MSSDIYIDLKIVANHISLFDTKCVHNGDIETFVEAMQESDPDYEHAADCIKPVLLCKFGARPTWRHVEVFDNDLHVSCSGEFRQWLVHWLTELNFKHTVIY